jgi:hypothetical protein
MVLNVSKASFISFPMKPGSKSRGINARGDPRERLARAAA